MQTLWQAAELCGRRTML